MVEYAIVRGSETTRTLRKLAGYCSYCGVEDPRADKAPVPTTNHYHHQYCELREAGKIKFGNICKMLCLVAVNVQWRRPE